MIEWVMLIRNDWVNERINQSYIISVIYDWAGTLPGDSCPTNIDKTHNEADTVIGYRVGNR